MAKKSISEKESLLLERIEKAKVELSKLQEKQKIQMGSLAYKYKLHELDKKSLDAAFKEIANKNNIAV